MSGAQTGFMAPVDAQLFWLSAALPNDQYLLYAFDDPRADPNDALDEIRRRALAIPALRLRVRDDRSLRYPRWVPADVTDDQIVVHRFPAMTALPDPLDTTRHTWRLHLYPPSTVVVQICHALGDGTRCAALAAALLGRPTPVPPVAPPRPGFLPWRAAVAARAHRRRAPEPATDTSPALSLNTAHRGPRAGVLRTLLVDAHRLRRPTVTAGALTAIGTALGGYLADRGEDVARLAAEVPVARPPIPGAHNNFGNARIGLHPALDPEARAARIAAELDAARTRAGSAAARAADAAFAAVPAWLLRWGMSRLDPDAPSPTVTGNTVVSSVNRGPADLSFAGAPVRHTAGFPALSPRQGLTHGVHGIGGVVAVSVHADPDVVDVDDYLARLADALG